MICVHGRALVFLLLLLPAAPLWAQDTEIDHLDETFEAVFWSILGSDFVQGPGQHASHFIPAAADANQYLVPALNSMIASNVAAFPLSSTVAGITFDFAGGKPVRVVESLGPIFAETAATLGPRKATVGVNATHLSLDRFRDMALDRMQYTFAHQDVDTSGVLGDTAPEVDLITVAPNLDVNATITAFYATYGVSRSLDIGIAVPFVWITMRGEARANVNSFTLVGPIGRALHSFGGSLTAPELTRSIPYDVSAKGLGDIALRAKYRLPTGSATGVALLVDVRLPTGDERDYLGTGDLNARFSVISSRKVGDFTPHLNVGYDYRGANLDSDEFEFAVGFDQKVGAGLTVAADLLGAFDLDGSETIDLTGEPISLLFTNSETGVQFTQTFPRSNVWAADRDHSLQIALGGRWAPVEQLQVLGNVVVPLLNRGLTSTIAPTLGVSVII